MMGATLYATGTIDGEIEKQPLNISAIVMFLLFVSGTLGITYWAAKRTKTAKDFYTAGGGITGLQNGMAIAGDYMSAASFLGISGLVYLAGYDGLIYSIGFLVGWPVILFLMSERLRNLGKYTFADVAAYRLKQAPIRTLAALGSIATVILYLIAQIVGAGKLIQLLFWIALRASSRTCRCIDDNVCNIWWYACDDLGTDHQSSTSPLWCYFHGTCSVEPLRL